MDEQELLHRISIDTNVNVEVLKDLYHNETFLALIKADQSTDAILFIRRNYPRLGLAGAKFIAEAFVKALK